VTLGCNRHGLIQGNNHVLSHSDQKSYIAASVSGLCPTPVDVADSTGRQHGGSFGQEVLTTISEEHRRASTAERWRCAVFARSAVEARVRRTVGDVIAAAGSRPPTTTVANFTRVARESLQQQHTPPRYWKRHYRSKWQQACVCRRVWHGTISPDTIQQINSLTQSIIILYYIELVNNVPLSILVLTFHRGKTAMVKRSWIIICKKQYQLCCSSYQFKNGINVTGPKRNHDDDDDDDWGLTALSAQIGDIKPYSSETAYRIGCAMFYMHNYR